MDKLEKLRVELKVPLQENVMLANYTTSRVGGPAVALIPANSLAELAHSVQALWALDLPFSIIGSGSNVLVSDKGYPGVIVLNRARNIKIDSRATPPTVLAESGANLSSLARQAALRGLSGMEWAVTIPGTVGGAVYGNAGAHGSDIQANLVMAEILHRTKGRQVWTASQLAYQYRSSILKRDNIPAVVLTARLSLTPSTPEQVKKKMEELTGYRRRTQPPGASMGSMFKNPPGDFAGRLIEAAGLKGTRIGDAEISAVHANFFINLGHASASDIWKLVQVARETVAEKFDVKLELEIERIGDWPEDQG